MASTPHVRYVIDDEISRWLFASCPFSFLPRSRLHLSASTITLSSPAGCDGVHGRGLGVARGLPGTARVRGVARRGAATSHFRLATLVETTTRLCCSRIATQIFVTLRTGKIYPPVTVDVRCVGWQRARRPWHFLSR